MLSHICKQCQVISHQTFLREMPEIQYHLLFKGAAFFQPNNFTGAGNGCSRLSHSWQHLSQRKFFAGMRGSVSPQRILLRMPARQSQVSTWGHSSFQPHDWIGDTINAFSPFCILPTERFFGDSDNTFSDLSENWQYFRTNYLTGDVGNVFSRLSTEDSIFNQIILWEMLRSHSCTCQPEGRFSPVWFYWACGHCILNLFHRWQHFPKNLLFGGYWQWIVILKHPLAAFFS